jgi:hypothetical protein
MKRIFLRNSAGVFLFIVIAGLALGLGLAIGEKKETKNKWDLITNKDGLVYRINKQTGEVFLIAGTGAVEVEGTENLEGQKDISPSAVDWPSQTITSAGNLVLKLKTKWRSGTLYYDFSIAKNDKLDQIKQSSPNAKITILLLDEDGFTILSIPVMLSDMTHVEGAGYDATGNVICGFNAYKNIKNWSYAWGGFQIQ